MRADCEILGAVLAERPADVLALINAVTTGDGEQARSLLDGLGLSEADFQARGGGFLWLIVGAAILLIAQEAH